MGKEGFEQLLGMHAAPLFVGLKAASLLAFRKADFTDIEAVLGRYDRCLRCKGIVPYRLLDTEQRILMLLYRPSALWRNLNQPLARDLLRQFGYRDGSSLEEKLAHLRSRVADGDSFPHEVGLFLGYPPADVAGFIRHKGHDSCLDGYWKVYCNKEAAQQLFAIYRQCTNSFCHRLSCGGSFEELVQAI